MLHEFEFKTAKISERWDYDHYKLVLLLQALCFISLGELDSSVTGCLVTCVRLLNVKNYVNNTWG